MVIKQRIHISGRNWNDILNLPCVIAVWKEPYWHVLFDKLVEIALVGDDIVQYEDDSWGIITSEDRDKK